jgi:2-polyprenyl-6-methoxyphenol hydroxylase-like FAD-dependent oxidoreductase
MLPWGVAAARRLGVVDDLLAAGGRQVPFFNVYFMGTQTEHRPFPMSTPTGEGSLNMYHPDLQETLLAGAANAGAEIMRGAYVQSIAEQEGGWKVTFGDNGEHSPSPPDLSSVRTAASRGCGNWAASPSGAIRITSGLREPS